MRVHIAETFQVKILMAGNIEYAKKIVHAECVAKQCDDLGRFTHTAIKARVEAAIQQAKGN